MIFRFVALTISAVLVFAAYSPVFAGELNRGLFSGRNHALLEKLIAENGKRSPAYDAKKRSYVVCDWDNTSAFGDAAETLAYYMLDNLLFPWSMNDFRKVVRLNVPQGPSKILKKDGRSVLFDDLIEDLVENYAYIYSNYRGLAGKMSLEEVKASEEYRDFAAKLYLMIGALDMTCGTSLADQWMGQLMSGMTRERLTMLSEQSIRKNLGGELRKIKLTGSDKLDRRCTGVPLTTFQGLRIYPDMGNLYQALMNNGIDVYIVSASPEDIIVPIATRKEYGYGIPRGHIFGAKYAEVNGIVQPDLWGERKMTWGPGKVDLIRTQFIAVKNYPPILVCGDSDGDYNMLSGFPETQLGLIVNRLKKGNIGTLCEQAHRQRNDSKPRYILQGIDENTGLFNADEATVKLGTTEKYLVK
jgi:phosphoserine phosphatase